MSALNNSLLLGQEGGGGYAISRSLRFNSSDSAYLSRTPASAGNRKTWTWAGWVKRVRPTWDTDYLFGAYYGGSLRYEYLAFTASDQIDWFSGLYSTSGTTTSGRKITASVYRDPSAWYHIVAVKDTTQATASNRFKLYVNGVQVSTFNTSTDPALNDESFINDSSTPHRVGGLVSTANSSQYLADIHFCDGTAYDASAFGEFDANGIWQPKKFAGVYGTNGFHLDFADNSTAAALGTDSSGRGNTWTVNNISVAAGAGNDSLVDVPTNGAQTDTGAGGEVRGNYATLNPLSAQANVILANGNLDWSTTQSSSLIAQSTIAMSSGKWYCEFTATSVANMFGLQRAAGAVATTFVGGNADSWGYYADNGNKYTNGGNSSYGASFTSGDVIGVAFDADAGTLTFYKNGASQGQAYSGLTNGPYTFALGNGGNRSAIANFGQRSFAYTAPSGFKALCTANLPAPVVTKPSDLFDVKLYTGNGSTQTISTNFSPDFLWFKARGDSGQHALYDIVRGASKSLVSNSTASEATEGGGLASFDSAGFSLSGDNTVQGSTNGSSRSYVAWAWDAGSSTVTNTQGSISSQVRANAAAGFSVCTFTQPSSSNSFSWGHGLGVAPELVFMKPTSASGNWQVYHKSTGAQYLWLNSTNAATGTGWSTVNSSVVTATATLWAGNYATVAYCFAPVAGYSSMGTYTGNGSADGPFVYTGFRPAWVLIKCSTQATYWNLKDSKRYGYNPTDPVLHPNLSDAESATQGIDFCSNGFKVRTSDGGYNTSGATYIYFAVAESPFQYARAR